MNETIVKPNLVDYDIDADMTRYLENLKSVADKYNIQNASYGKDNQNSADSEKPYVAFLKSEIVTIENKTNQINNLISESQMECNTGKITEEENIKNIDAYFTLLAELKVEQKALETDLTLCTLMQTEIKKRSNLVWTNAQLNDTHIVGEKREQLIINKAVLEDELDKIDFEKKSKILSLLGYVDKDHKKEINTRSQLYTDQYESNPGSLVNAVVGSKDQKPFETEAELDEYLKGITL